MSATAELVNGEQPMNWRTRLKPLAVAGAGAGMLFFALQFLNLFSAFAMPMEHTVRMLYTTHVEFASADVLRERIESAFPRATASITTRDHDPEEPGCGQGFTSVAVSYRANILGVREINDGFHRIASAAGYRACSGLRMERAPSGASPLGPLAGATILGGGLMLLFVRARTRPHLRAKWLDWSPRVDGRTALRWGTLGYVLFALASLVEWIGVTAGLEPGGSGTLERMSRQSILTTLPFAVLMAPLAEEYIFRAWLLERFARVIPPVLALLWTSALFVAIHMPQNVLQGVEIMVVGVGLGLIWLRTRSLLATVAAHGVYNATLFAILWIATG